MHQKDRLSRKGNLFLLKKMSFLIVWSDSHLASNAQVVAPSVDNPNFTILGDPTEACLNVLMKKQELI